MQWWPIVFKSIWGGIAALGFGVMFNVPKQSFASILLLGGVGIFIKIALLSIGSSIVFASFLGAITIGVLSIPAAHIKHCPPIIFYIPAIIPMIPGILAYRMMLGFIYLSENTPSANYQKLLVETVNSGLKVLFTLISLSVGVILPMIIMRKGSVKQLRLRLDFYKAF